MLDLFWDLYQQQQIGQAKSDAARASSKATSVADTVFMLRKQVDGLALLNQTLVEILMYRFNVTKDEIVQKMNEIDLRDGVKDGRIGGGTGKCPQCDRTYNVRLNKCLYCGHVKADGSILGA